MSLLNRTEPRQLSHLKNKSETSMLWASARVFVVPALYAMPLFAVAMIVVAIVRGTNGMTLNIGPFTIDNPPIWATVAFLLSLTVTAIGTIYWIKKIEKA